MIKIGAELPKLSQKIKLGIRFLDHPVMFWLRVKSVDIGSRQLSNGALVFEQVNCGCLYLFSAFKIMNIVSLFSVWRTAFHAVPIDKCLQIGLHIFLPFLYRFGNSDGI